MRPAIGHQALPRSVRETRTRWEATQGRVLGGETARRMRRPPAARPFAKMSRRMEFDSGAHGRRATSLAAPSWRARAASLATTFAAVAALASGVTGCGEGAAKSSATEAGAGALRVAPDDLVPRDTPVPDWARQSIAEFVELMQPLDPTVTSDQHDLQYHRERAMVQRLEQGAPEVGWAALHAFTNFKERDFKIRRNLLRVGARAAPKEAETLLEFLAFTYGPYIEDRTEACLLFAEIAPERYMQLARPFVVRRGVLHETLPNDEFLVKGWVKACEVSGTSPVAVMSDVATNLMLEPYGRVIALRVLGQNDLTPESRGALQTCLIESLGDGFVRRVAAQSILKKFPREDACTLMRAVLAREADPNMALFLDELIQENCR